MDLNATIIGQSIAMIVFVWFCMKYIWPPLMDAIEERQTQIADGLAAGEEGKIKLDNANVESKKILDDARKQATSILDQANARANEIVADGKKDGQTEREQQLSLAILSKKQIKPRTSLEVRSPNLQSHRLKRF